MKANRIIALSVLIALGFTACEKDYLDRMPLSEISEESVFYSSRDLELYTNGFYNDLPGFSIITNDNKSDNVLYGNLPLEQSGERIVPGEPGSGGWNWGALRKINFFFDHYERCDDEQAKKEYSGVAYFFRAYFYYNKLTRFGDVPWYDHVISTTDEDDLMKPRDPRQYVVKKMVEDIDHAIANLNTRRAADRINKWTALALKSRICLFEGTYRKYHTELNLGGADTLLQLAWQAAEQVMRLGPYHLYSTGDHRHDYMMLFASDEAKEEEVMLTRRYTREANSSNNINYYFLATTMQDIGLSKDMVNSYLQKDGTPFTKRPGYQTLTFYEEMQNRDPRLAQTVRTPGYKRIGGSNPLVPNFGASMSGYQIVKYVSDENEDGYKMSYQDIPIIRYAEVLLNFAEAKAELGILTQDDLDRSIGLLRKRVGMPLLLLDNANNNPDPVEEARYPNVTGPFKGAILEIRRERRIELVLEGFRYNDLMRWKTGKLLEKHFRGMYFPGYGEFDLDRDGNNDILVYEAGTQPTPSSSDVQQIEVGEGSLYIFSDGTQGNVVPFYDRIKSFNEERDYLYPIPSGDLLLNPNLVQNPNW